MEKKLTPYLSKIAELSKDDIKELVGSYESTQPLHDWELCKKTSMLADGIMKKVQQDAIYEIEVDKPEHLIVVQGRKTLDFSQDVEWCKLRDMIKAREDLLRKAASLDSGQQLMDGNEVIPRVGYASVGSDYIRMK